jgi:hypothetical protein
MDTVNEFPQVAELDLYTCQDKLVCFLSPYDKACSNFKTLNPIKQFYFTTRNGTSPIQSCTSVAGNETETCTKVDFDACLASELYPGW